MANYDMLGSFSTGNASKLNAELITKLKEADSKATVKPLETQLENIDKEREKITEINTKISELLTSIKSFDLFSSTSNIFEQITSSGTGDAATFDAPDLGKLKPGSISVDISQLAQKDVFQSSEIASANIDNPLGNETLSIQVGSNAAVNISTDGLTLKEVAEKINNEVTGADAAVEQVTDGSYRLVIKSTDSGTANALTITGTASQTLGFTTDGTTKNAASQTLEAKNMKATVDGVAYDVSSNNITIDGGLKITGVKLGNSTLTIQKDPTKVEPAIQKIATAFNELVTLVNDEVYAEKSSIYDKSTLLNMISDIKSKFYKTDDSGNSLFNFGISFDNKGKMLIDTKALNEGLTNNFDAIKNIFLGKAEDKGVGTDLKEYLDKLNWSGGRMTTYLENMDKRVTTITEEKEKAQKTLDQKYQDMSAKFSQYAAVISKLESNFNGLKMMIQQSVASK